MLDPAFDSAQASSTPLRPHRLRSGLIDSAQASSTPLRPHRLRSGLVAGWAASNPATLSPLVLSTYLSGHHRLGRWGQPFCG